MAGWLAGASILPILDYLRSLRSEVSSLYCTAPRLVKVKFSLIEIVVCIHSRSSNNTILQKKVSFANTMLLNTLYYDVQTSCQKFALCKTFWNLLKKSAALFKDLL